MRNHKRDAIEEQTHKVALILASSATSREDERLVVSGKNFHRIAKILAEIDSLTWDCGFLLEKMFYDVSEPDKDNIEGRVGFEITQDQYEEIVYNMKAKIQCDRIHSALDEDGLAEEVADELDIAKEEESE